MKFYRRFNLVYCIILVLVLLSSISDAKDLYKILGLTRDATDVEIKKAFRKLSMKYHPDINPDASETFVEITEAHDILSDPDKRHIYDVDGYDAITNPSPQYHDPFAAMFGGRQSGGRPKGPNAKVEVEVSLEQLYLGTEIPFTITRNILCPKCRGSGGEDSEYVTCTACRGRGQVIKMQNLGPGFQIQTQAPCDVCDGRGKVPKTRCPHCKGKRVVNEKKELVAVIEPGMKHGDHIVFERESEQTPQTTPGDVITIIKQAPHSKFKRIGDDLHYDLVITLKDALLGFTKTINQLDGRPIQVSKSGVTQPFEIITIQDEGMPLHTTPSLKGKLHVKCLIAYPNSLTDKQRTALQGL